MSKIAFIVADDCEDSEFGTPKPALQEAGYEIDVIGTEEGVIRGKQGTDVSVDLVIDAADPKDYVALVIPGGFSPDHLRTNDRVVDFVRSMAEQHVPIATVCHAPSLLIEAGLVEGKTVTSWPSIRTDLANVVDQEVVIDGQIITSRRPDDLPAFSAAIIGQLVK